MRPSLQYLNGNPLNPVFECFYRANAASPGSFLRNQDGFPGRIFDTDAPDDFFASGLSAHNVADDKTGPFFAGLAPNGFSWIADISYYHNTSA